MTQEDKTLLLKDLCARLPYGVICTGKYIDYDDNDNRIFKDTTGELTQVHFTKNCCYLNVGLMNECEIETIKPYLRPMSSMNSKEWMEYCDASLEDEKSWVWAGKEYKFTPVTHREEFLKSHHFDYRGLIPMELALEAPENMYKHFGDMDVVVTSVEHKDKL